MAEVDWQQIETAPKDGTRILLWMVPEVGYGCTIGEYYESQLWGPVWRFEDEHTVEIAGASHWMPLPSGPVSS